jgi:hypothetical protein
MARGSISHIALTVSDLERSTASEIAIRLLVAKQIIGGGEDRGCDREHRFFGAAPGLKPQELPVCGELLILGETSNSPHTGRPISVPCSRGKWK